jgi:glycosyltransferase involved in cell wall biosynthesis
MRLSIILVNYNSADTIESYFDSLLSQNVSDYELVVVDGESNDGSLDIIRDFLPSVGCDYTLISEKDDGIFDAMNKGVKLCQGEYITFLNADDAFLGKNSLKLLLEYLSGDFDVVYGDILVRGRFGVAWKSCLQSAHSLSLYSFPYHPGFVARRKLVLENGLMFNTTDYPNSADLSWMSTLVKMSGQTLVYDFPLVVFTIGGFSSKLSNKFKILREMSLLLDRSIISTLIGRFRVNLLETRKISL